MCLYPRFIKNPKYLPNKKNNNNPPACTDWRVMFVPVGCGKCIECKKQKARQWQVRLNEELKEDNKTYFVTLSFSPKELEQLAADKTLHRTLTEIKTIECNAVAALAVRRFLERWRKKNKKSVKHWLITELGDKFTERIHIHGLIWTEKPQEIENIWKYGNVWIGDYVTNKTINYIVKYCTKVDIKHKTYEPQIFCSAGLGKRYINTFDAKQNKYKPNQTKEYYRLPNGQKINLPIYYRNKIYSEKEREQLWLEKIEKKEIYIMGEKHSIKTEKDRKLLEDIRKTAQKDNILLGYGDNSKEWKEEAYNITLRMLNRDNKESK